MSKKRFIAWIGDAMHHAAFDADDFDGAVHEATEWVTGIDFGPDYVGVTVRINELGETGNIRYWDTVYIRVFPKPDLRRKLDEVLSRWKAIAASDTSDDDFSLLRGLIDYLDAVDLDEENSDASPEPPEKGSYFDSREVYDIRDDKHQHFVVAKDGGDAMKRCGVEAGCTRCRPVPWDEKISVYSGVVSGDVTKTARDWARTEPYGIFTSKTLSPEEWMSDA